MNYAVEESVVDAMVSYLTSKLGDGMAVFAAPTTDSIKYPCVTVRVKQLNPISSETQQWAACSKPQLELVVFTDALDKVDDVSNITTPCRILHARHRSLVFNALNIPPSVAAPEGIAELAASYGATKVPTGLAAWLDIQRTPGVWITLAVPVKGAPLVTMEVDPQTRTLQATIGVSTVAEAIEITGG